MECSNCCNNNQGGLSRILDCFGGNSCIFIILIVIVLICCCNGNKNCC